MKPIVNYGLSDSLIDAVRKSVEEARGLVGDQPKLDTDHDNDIDAIDLAALRARRRAKKDAVDTKPKLKEEDEQIDELDASTLKSYKDKAGAQARWAGGVAKALGAQRKSARPEESKYRESNVTDPKADYGPEGNKYAKLSQKRGAGAAKAGKRLGETYKISREEYEQMDEISSELAGRASNARIDRNMSGGTSHTDIRKLKKGSMTPLDQQRKTTGAYMKTLDRKNEEYEQMDEKYRPGGNPGPTTRQRAAILNKMKPLDPNATVIHKDGMYSSSKGYPHRDQLKDHIHKESGHKVMIPSTTNDMHDAVTGDKIATNVYSGKHTAKSLVRAVKKFHKEEYEMMDEASAQDIVARLKKKHKDGNYSVGPGGEVTHPYLEKDSIDRRIAALKEEDEQMDEARSEPVDISFETRRGKTENQQEVEHAARYEKSHGVKSKFSDGPNGRTVSYSHPDSKKVKGALIKHHGGEDVSHIKIKEAYELDEVKLADLPRRFVPGRPGQYDGANYVDPQGADETAADMKKAEPKRKSGPQGTMKRRFNTKSYDKIKGRLKAQY